MNGLRLPTALLALCALTACGDDGGTDSGANDTTGQPPSTGSTTIAESTTAEPSDSSDGTTGTPPATSTADETTEGPPDTTDTTGEPLDGDVLQNDSWTPADALTWQTWPNANDCWASTFQAAGAQYPFELVGARAAIGGGGGVETFTVAVWEVDNQGMPTTEVDSTTFMVDGSTAQLTDVDLTGLSVPAFMMMNQEFALVMCHTAHMGAPSIAIDADGTVDGTRNWVYQQAMGEWVPSPDFFGTDGDFILRALIMPV